MLFPERSFDYVRFLARRVLKVYGAFWGGPVFRWNQTNKMYTICKFIYSRKYRHRNIFIFNLVSFEYQLRAALLFIELQAQFRVLRILFICNSTFFKLAPGKSLVTLNLKTEELVDNTSFDLNMLGLPSNSRLMLHFPYLLYWVPGLLSNFFSTTQVSSQTYALAKPIKFRRREVNVYRTAGMRTRIARSDRRYGIYLMGRAGARQRLMGSIQHVPNLLIFFGLDGVSGHGPREAYNRGVPSIGFVETQSDSLHVTYPIHGNAAAPNLIRHYYLLFIEAMKRGQLVNLHRTISLFAKDRERNPYNLVYAKMQTRLYTYCSTLLVELSHSHWFIIRRLLHSTKFFYYRFQRQMMIYSIICSVFRQLRLQYLSYIRYKIRKVYFRKFAYLPTNVNIWIKTRFLQKSSFLVDILNSLFNYYVIANPRRRGYFLSKVYKFLRYFFVLKQFQSFVVNRYGEMKRGMRRYFKRSSRYRQWFSYVILKRYRLGFDRLRTLLIRPASFLVSDQAQPLQHEVFIKSRFRKSSANVTIHNLLFGLYILMKRWSMVHRETISGLYGYRRDGVVQPKKNRFFMAFSRALMFLPRFLHNQISFQYFKKVVANYYIYRYRMRDIIFRGRTVHKSIKTVYLRSVRVTAVLRKLRATTSQLLLRLNPMYTRLIAITKAKIRYIRAELLKPKSQWTRNIPVNLPLSLTDFSKRFKRFIPAIYPLVGGFVSVAHSLLLNHLSTLLRHKRPRVTSYAMFTILQFKRMPWWRVPNYSRRVRAFRKAVRLFKYKVNPMQEAFFDCLRTALVFKVQRFHRIANYALAKLRLAIFWRWYYFEVKSVGDDKHDFTHLCVNIDRTWHDVRISGNWRPLFWGRQLARIHFGPLRYKDKDVQHKNVWAPLHYQLRGQFIRFFPYRLTTATWRPFRVPALAQPKDVCSRFTLARAYKLRFLRMLRSKYEFSQLQRNLHKRVILKFSQLRERRQKRQAAARYNRWLSFQPEAKRDLQKKRSRLPYLLRLHMPEQEQAGILQLNVNILVVSIYNTKKFTKIVDRLTRQKIPLPLRALMSRYQAMRTGVVVQPNRIVAPSKSRKYKHKPHAQRKLNYRRIPQTQEFLRFSKRFQQLSTKIRKSKRNITDPTLLRFWKAFTLVLSSPELQITQPIESGATFFDRMSAHEKTIKYSGSLRFLTRKWRRGPSSVNLSMRRFRARFFKEHYEQKLTRYLLEHRDYRLHLRRYTRFLGQLERNFAIATKFALQRNNNKQVSLGFLRFFAKRRHSFFPRLHRYRGIRRRAFGTYALTRLRAFNSLPNFCAFKQLLPRTFLIATTQPKYTYALKALRQVRNHRFIFISQFARLLNVYKSFHWLSYRARVHLGLVRAMYRSRILYTSLVGSAIVPVVSFSTPRVNVSLKAHPLRITIPFQTFEFYSYMAARKFRVSLNAMHAPRPRWFKLKFAARDFWRNDVNLLIRTFLLRRYYKSAALKVLQDMRMIIAAMYSRYASSSSIFTSVHAFRHSAKLRHTFPYIFFQSKFYRPYTRIYTSVKYVLYAPQTHHHFFLAKLVEMPSFFSHTLHFTNLLYGSVSMLLFLLPGYVLLLWGLAFFFFQYSCPVQSKDLKLARTQHPDYQMQMLRNRLGLEVPSNQPRGRVVVSTTAKNENTDIILNISHTKKKPKSPQFALSRPYSRRVFRPTALMQLRDKQGYIRFVSNMPFAVSVSGLNTSCGYVMPFLYLCRFIFKHTKSS